MSRLIILSLLCGGAHTMGEYGGDDQCQERVQELEGRVQELEEELAQCQAAIVTCGPTPAPTADPTPAPLNGCGDPCADVVTISSTSFLLTFESGTCYVVDGSPSSTLTVPDGVEDVTVGAGGFEFCVN